MGHRLILEVPQEVYDPLAAAANRSGATPEELAVAWLTAVSLQAAQDPVEGFIGVVRGNVPDWAEQHDKYLGEALRDELSGEGRAGS